MAFKALTVNTPPAQAAHILAEDDAAVYGGLLGQDCVLPIGQKLKATVISNNKVRIADGAVSVGGHIGRVISGDYEDMTIANGVSGKKRNDIIAARFIAGASGGADTYKLVVIQGAAGTTAADPTYVKGDLYSGDKQRDYPLWRIKIEGLSIVKVEQMYTTGVSDAELLSRMTNMNKDLLAKIQELNSALEKDYIEAPGDYYYSGSIIFYELGNLGIQVYTSEEFTLKNTSEFIGKGWFTIGYIPQNVSPPAYNLYSTMVSQGRNVCGLALTPGGEIKINALDNLISNSPAVNLVYFNFKP